MRKLRFAGLALLALAWSPCGQAVAGPPARGFYVRGGFDYSGHSLADLEDYTGLWNAAMMDEGLPTSFGDLGWAPGLVVEAGYHVTEALSLGVGFALGRHSTDDSSAGVLDTLGSPLSIRYARKLDVSFTEVTANATYWFPPARDLFLGARIGLGMGTLDEEVSRFAAAASGVESNVWSGEFTGSGFTAAVFAGYQVRFGSWFAAFGQLGYRHRDLGRFTGRFVADGEPEPGGDHEYAGLPNAIDPERHPFRAVEFDGSGPYVSLGLGVSFGGRPRR